MDLIAELKKDLEKGFSKRDLERLIGLPVNSLSNILSGKKKPSKKYSLKVEKWMVSKKPDPLSVIYTDKGVCEVNLKTGFIEKFTPPPKKEEVDHKTLMKEFPLEVHKKYKEGDPPEGSNAFYLRYGVRKYDDI